MPAALFFLVEGADDVEDFRKALSLVLHQKWHQEKAADCFMGSTSNTRFVEEKQYDFLILLVQASQKDERIKWVNLKASLRKKIPAQIEKLINEQLQVLGWRQKKLTCGRYNSGS